MIQKKTIQVSGIIALMAISITGFAQTKVVVVPLGGDEAPTHKVVFLTAEAYSGDLGGPEGADAICQANADAPNSLVQGRSFKAWISGGLAPDLSNNGRFFNRSTLEYRLLGAADFYGSTLIALNYTDLLDGTVERPIDRGADGEENFINDPIGVQGAGWTGIADDGAFTGFDCDGWTSGSTEDKGTYTDVDGFIDSGFWTDVGSVSCDHEFQFYCFEQ